MKYLVIAVTIFIATFASAANAQDGAAIPTQKADAALEQKIRGLIMQLGDADWHKREVATNELKSIGLPAVPFLQEAKNSADPEIRTRAEDILLAINPPPPPKETPVPAGPVPLFNQLFQMGQGQIVIGGANRMVVQIGGGQAMATAVETRMFNADGKQYKVTKTTENGKKTMSVEITEDVDGKPVRRIVEAADEKELEKKDPALAKILNENTVGNMIQQVRAAINMQLGGMPVAPELPPNPVATNILDLLDSVGLKLQRDENGLRVADIKAASPADKLGLQIGDWLKKVNGQAITDFESARKTLGDYAPTKPLEIEVSRDGKPIVMKAAVKP